MDEGQIRFEEIYRENYEAIFSYVYRMTRFDVHEAEDLTQSVFLVAFQKWNSLQDHPNISGFLMQVAKNRLMKWSVQRRTICVKDAEVLAVLAKAAGRSEAYELAELCLFVERTLSREQMEILRSYYLYGYSAREMSDRLGIRETCFKTRVARMKHKLRKSLWLLAAVALLTQNP